MSHKTHVVIVGGGHAGIGVAVGVAAKLDASRYHIILINPRSYFIPYPPTLRLVVSESAKLEHTALVPFDRLFKKGNGEVKTGIVTSIEPRDARSGGHVILEGGERIPYEVLVLASGSTWKGPIDFPVQESEVLPHIHTWRRKFADAKHVVIVGGGAVGIELAGELKDEHPGKKVTIVQGDSQLLNRTYPTTIRHGLATRLRARDVDLLFDERIDTFPEEGTVGVVTRNGTQIPDADLVISTRGASPNTAFIGSLGSSTLSESGFVKVKPTLQLVGYTHIFAAGDILDWAEQKQAAKTNDHAKVVVQNVLKVLAGKSVGLAEYKGSFELIVVPVGRNGGMCYFPFFGGFTLGDFFTRLIKGRGLMLGMFRSSVGY